MSRFIRWFVRAKSYRVKSPRMRSALLYLFFVFIAAILWSFLTINKYENYDIDVVLKIDAPKNIKLLNHLPDKITVSVYEKGTTLIRQHFSAPVLTLNFEDYSDGNGNFRVDQVQLKRVIGRLLGNSTRVTSILPESLAAHYTDQPGKLVPIVLKIEAIPAAHHAINGPIELSSDSVLIYGDSETLNNINEAYTYQVKLNNLTDTTLRKVNMAPIPGAVIEPRSIDVVVPIDRLITKTQRVNISVRNAPQGVRVIVFPSAVDVSYRVPKSFQSHSANDITAVVDYNSIDLSSKGNKVEVKTGEVPGKYADVKLMVDSVEYIIEREK